MSLYSREESGKEVKSLRTQVFQSPVQREILIQLQASQPHGHKDSWVFLWTMELKGLRVSEHFSNCNVRVSLVLSVFPEDCR